MGSMGSVGGVVEVHLFDSAPVGVTFKPHTRLNVLRVERQGLREGYESMGVYGEVKELGPCLHHLHNTYIVELPTESR
jgi:hypothetical protein